ncbi:MAG: CehA/McbA family metallohydrolase [Candidatus Omnitrophica bacterium]|nr:CehA/McbA family metallohydrolase [Candidatus Omnitrophota bacterium]
MLWPIGSRVPHHPARAQETLEDGYHDHPGVIHVHTTYSHDADGTLADVARVANAEGLHYVITTEHNNLRSLREGNQGWHGMTLILVGEEVSTRDGHVLALNVQEEIDRDQPTQAILDEIARQGGLSFLAHPYFKKHRWKNWSVQGFTGIEGYNTTHDAFDENLLRVALWGLTVSPHTLYLSLVDRPYDPLDRWDALVRRHGRVVGIGSSDAHEVRLLGVKFVPYEVLFKLVRTHLLVPAGAALSPAAVYEALRAGHAYFSLDLLADATGFTFMADDGQQVFGVMGDEIELADPMQLTVILPASAHLALFKDGSVTATSVGRVWHIRVSEPGSYRVEASLNGKPWIFSNPIYVSLQPTAHSIQNEPSSSMPSPTPTAE